MWPEGFRSNTAFKHHLFKNKSNWQPTAPPTIEGMILLNETEVSKINSKNPKMDNLSRAERSAIHTLKNNKDITIKPADKGSAVVILNTTDYIAEATTQLNNPKFYKKMDHDPTQDHHLEVQKVLKEMLDREEIDQSCYDYLNISKPRTPRFYTLPKIHKATRPPPGRPITSANQSPTERISAFVDYFLKPTIPHIKSYVRDTTDFLRKIKDIPALPPGTLLVTLDVTSLYTNIPNKEGIRAVAKTLAKYRPGQHHPSNQSLIQLLDIVLYKNNFEFNGDHFLQTSGTAMGTRVAPSYANNFMGNHEDTNVYTYVHQPHTWLRFIDDIFMIWTHGRNELELFIQHLNTCHPTIKFTAEISSESVNFLDTSVHLNPDGTLTSDLFTKPTDSHNYLLYNSSHPLHCKNSLPYSQFLRVRRICSSIKDFDKNASMLRDHFLRRGYPQELINQAIAKARSCERHALLNPNKTTPQKSDKESTLFAISTYQPNFSGLKGIIRRNWHQLLRSNDTKYLFTSKLIFGHRRSKNLRLIGKG